MAEEDTEHRLSLRVSAEVMELIEGHQQRLKRYHGAPFTRTQAVTSLIEIGSLTWMASERVGALSPALLIAKGADTFGLEDAEAEG